ncbi:MAG: outer membrane lipoprotein carrier protein LolA [Oligoflexia bacterium]|nr:outer membrane lipoprotein carrier protein LolA [Oligoflexia bacterium]
MGLFIHRKEIALLLKIFYISEVQKTLPLFLFIFPFVSLGETKGKAQALEIRSHIKQGSAALKKTLEKYQLSSFQIQVSQEVFLSVIKTNWVSKGFLSVKNQKFRLDLEGKPSSLTVFDGHFLWYQADKRERLVFKLKNPLGFQILTNFFSWKDFFNNFQIKEFQKKDQFEFYRLQPKIEIKDLKEIFMKVDGFILEIRLIWQNLNNWQKYNFSPPAQKDFPVETFQFPVSGFQVKDQF